MEILGPWDLKWKACNSRARFEVHWRNDNEMLTFVWKAKWKVRIIQPNSALNLNWICPYRPPAAATTVYQTNSRMDIFFLGENLLAEVEYAVCWNSPPSAVKSVKEAQKERGALVHNSTLSVLVIACLVRYPRTHALVHSAFYLAYFVFHFRKNSITLLFFYIETLVDNLAMCRVLRADPGWFSSELGDVKIFSSC